MAKKTQNSFFKRCWFGLFCFSLLLIIIVWSLATMTKRMPSSSLGEFKFFAKESKGAVCKILNPPNKFRFYVVGGKNFIFEKNISQSKQGLPYFVTVAQNSVSFNSLDLNIDENVLDSIWMEGPVSIEKEGETFKFEIGYDARIKLIQGIYVVEGNSIIDHYFESVSMLGSLLICLLIAAFYVFVTVIKIFFRALGRKKRPVPHG